MGSQWFSWIHIQDLTSMIRFVTERQELTGPINATAPESVRMRNFCKVLGEVLHKPSWLPAPKFLLKIALGQMAEMLIHAQRAVPQRILSADFEFRFPKLKSALEDVWGTCRGTMHGPYMSIQTHKKAPSHYWEGTFEIRQCLDAA